MRIVISRRDSLRTALAALVAPLFAWLRPAQPRRPQTIADAARQPLATTYRYDGQGRLLSVTTDQG